MANGFCDAVCFREGGLRNEVLEFRDRPAGRVLPSSCLGSDLSRFSEQAAVKGERLRLGESLDDAALLAHCLGERVVKHLARQLVLLTNGFEHWVAYQPLD